MLVWQKLQDIFQVFIVLLIGSKMSNILAAQVHSGLDKGRMGDVISSKIVLDNKKPLKKILLSQMLTCDGFTNWLNAHIITIPPPQKKLMTDSDLFIYASTWSKNDQRTLFWLV